MKLENCKIGIIGLGYVGLPLAVAFAEKYFVVGFDINQERVNELIDGNDITFEVDTKELQSVLISNLNSFKGLFLTTEQSNLEECNVYIVTVPTPVDNYKRPLLTSMIKASETIGFFLKEGDIVIYESTVYPGLTEEEMVPVLEQVSGLKYNKNFFCGYSPERINPGDKEHSVKNIVKVTSGSTPQIATFIDQLYKSIISAGTFKASSIKVAEAAKVIENSQRDINIAFLNELSKIFNLIGIDTNDVLEAAGTKWNFLKFKPGLVGGHCIGVDPYYIAQKAQEVGYHPEIILAGRRVNDSMGNYLATEIVKLMAKQPRPLYLSSVLILGITFKENCPDIRNSKVVDLYNELMLYHLNIDVYDSFADKLQVEKEFDIQLIHKLDKKYDAIILAVPHNNFHNLNLRDFLSNDGFIYDIKGFLPKELVDYRL